MKQEKQLFRADNRGVSQLTAAAMLLGSAFVLAIALAIFLLADGAF